MTTPLFDLPCEPGKRVERTEWGVRWLRDHVTNRRGQITSAPSEGRARWWATDPEAQYCGFPAGAVEVVSRTVVTYTGRWERGMTAPIEIPEPNLICICGHYRSDHDNELNPQCGEGMWITVRGVGWFDECDCPGFEADPKASGDNE